MNVSSVMSRDYHCTHTLAECMVERQAKPTLAFCATLRCVHERKQVIYRVRGLGRGVTGRGRDICTSCQMPLFHSNDYFLLHDGRLADAGQMVTVNGHKVRKKKALLS